MALMKPKIDRLLKRSQTHTGRVKWLRRFLPIVAVLSVLSVCLWSTFDIFFERKIDGIPDKARDFLTHNEVLNPRINSTDSNGNPYKIEAQKALQKADSQAVFDKPCCEIVGPKGQQIKLNSDQGVLNQKDQKFVYNEHVHLETNDGYTVDTKKATVDLKSQNVTGSDPVTGRGPAGNITSKEGFFLDKKAQELHFKGPTRMQLQPKVSTPKGDLS